MTIHVASPTDAERIVALHNLWRASWPGFMPESIEGVRTAITDDGMVYLLSPTGAICLHADTPRSYGFIDFPYSSLSEAESLIQAGLTQLAGLRVECPIAADRIAEAQLLQKLGFTLRSTQRWMKLTTFPKGAIQLSEETEICQPNGAELEALHDVIFTGHSKARGWQQNPDIYPAIGLRRSGVLAGYVITEIHAGRPLISELGVHPSYRRAGLGRALTLLGLKQLRQAGALQVELLVNDSHAQHAPQLYESVGFGTTSYLRRYELQLEQP